MRVLIIISLISFTLFSCSKKNSTKENKILTYNKTYNTSNDRFNQGFEGKNITHKVENGYNNSDVKSGNIMPDKVRNAQTKQKTAGRVKSENIIPNKETGRTISENKNEYKVEKNNRKSSKYENVTEKNSENSGVRISSRNNIIKEKNNKNEDNDYLKVKVKKGESLWAISKKYLKEPTKWRELLKYNNISNPNMIRPGLVLKVPDYLSRIILAKISFYSGSVKVKKDSLSRWTKAFIKEKLGKDSMVRSYSKSRALLNFYTGDKLTIKENSLVSLNEIVKNGIKTTTIKLHIGNIFAQVKKLRKNRAFNIETPAAVAGVRGTDFIVKSDKNKRSLFGVYGGKIMVRAQGKEVIVNAGYGVEVKYGKPPSKPFKLPAKPEILK